METKLMETIKRAKSTVKYFFERTLKKSPYYYSQHCFHYYKCLFVHVPKTAGVSISVSLFGNLSGGHSTMDDYRYRYQKDFEDYFKFSFVRNPYDRLLSAYLFLKNGGFDLKDKLWADERLGEMTSFRSFVHDWLNQDRIWSKNHFHPQHHYLLLSENSSLTLDFIGKYETLHKDFNFVCHKLQVKRSLKHLNRTVRHLNTNEAYTLEMKQKVKKLYRRDFLLFDY